MPRIQYPTPLATPRHVFAAAACAATVYAFVGMAAPQIGDDEIVYEPQVSVVAAAAAPEPLLIIDADAVELLKSQKSENDSVRFQKLVQQWRDQRGSMSAIDDMSMLIPYQNIIGMGIDAMPLLLAQLKADGDDPDQWFWALQTIAEANALNPPVVQEEDQGNYQKLAAAWLGWGESQGYAV